MGSHSSKTATPQNGVNFLSQVPRDVLSLILMECDFSTLLKLGRTCKAMKQETDSDSYWKRLYLKNYSVSDESEDPWKVPLS